MRVSQLKASHLKTLGAVTSAQLAVDLSNGTHALPGCNAGFCVAVEHRGLFYTVGHWGDWQGEFWVVECSTGMIFRGSLTYIKEVIVLCSACHYEPNEVR